MNGNSLREHLLEHAARHPALQVRDVCKFLFQSAFGCEHLVASQEAAAASIRAECAQAPVAEPALEPLGGAYVRVHLSYLGGGLGAETLSRLFVASAVREPNGPALLEDGLAMARGLIDEGALPVDGAAFEAFVAEWRAAGFPAIRHSEAFRAAYRPAYRVIAARFAPLLPLLTVLDRRLAEGPLVLAIEGGCAGGKTTLASLLAELYGASVFHMDDFFLRPEQRTPERLSEVGGNVDRERFLSEVLLPLRRGEPVILRPYDCSTGQLTAPLTVDVHPLTVIEGVYSMHPALAGQYDLSVFLELPERIRLQRLARRCSAAIVERFLNEWIPLEERYFAGMRVKERCDIVLTLATEADGDAQPGCS